MTHTLLEEQLHDLQVSSVSLTQLLFLMKGLYVWYKKVSRKKYVGLASLMVGPTILQANKSDGPAEIVPIFEPCRVPMFRKRAHQCPMHVYITDAFALKLGWGLGCCKLENQLLSPQMSSVEWFREEDCKKGTNIQSEDTSTWCQ